MKVWKGIKKWFKSDFCWSTIALWFGWLNLISEISRLGQKLPPRGGDYFFALIVLLGIYAYRSQKKRKLGVKPNRKLRQVMEIILLLFLMYISLGKIDQMYEQPFILLTIPVWIITAYIVVWIKKYPKDSSVFPRDERE